MRSCITLLHSMKPCRAKIEVCRKFWNLCTDASVRVALFPSYGFLSSFVACIACSLALSLSFSLSHLPDLNHPPPARVSGCFIHPHSHATVGSPSTHNTMSTIVLIVWPNATNFSCDYPIKDQSIIFLVRNSVHTFGLLNFNRSGEVHSIKFLFLSLVFV